MLYKKFIIKKVSEKVSHLWEGEFPGEPLSERLSGSFALPKVKESYLNLLISHVLFIILILSGCSSKLSSVLSESWSDNYALQKYGTEVSHMGINDGDLNTWGVTDPVNREYIITFPEIKDMRKIVLYSGNITSYKLFYLDNRSDKWKLAGDVKSAKIGKVVNYEKLKTEIFVFEHRVKLKTNKLRIDVTRATSDRLETKRKPDENDRVINRRIEYIGTGRSSIKLVLYDVLVEGPAKLREIRVYGYPEKTEIEQ
jgi:hypothetical protein